MRFFVKKIKIKIFIFLFIYMFYLSIQLFLFINREKVEDFTIVELDSRILSGRFLISRDLLIELSLFHCNFASHYIKHSIALSYQKNNTYFDPMVETRRLKKAFYICNLQKSLNFFNQINSQREIKLTKEITENEQIENIVNYYYLIEHSSLLSEMKRMNYQSEDALLIMEKLEIDIDWNKNHDDRIIHEDFYRKNE